MFSNAERRWYNKNCQERTQVRTEAIQTILRREAYPHPYEGKNRDRKEEVL